MSKYRKKPVVVEAVHYDSMGNFYDAEDGLPEWMWDALENGTILPQYQRSDEGCPFLIKTLEGDHFAMPGDFIIRGVTGELYPCKPDIFEATYEEVPDGND